MKWCVRIVALAAVGMIVPNFVCAQDGGFADEISSLHVVLQQLYDDMMPLKPLCLFSGRATLKKTEISGRGLPTLGFRLQAYYEANGN